jgi:hypothetical protein
MSVQKFHPPQALEWEALSYVYVGAVRQFQQMPYPILGCDHAMLLEAYWGHYVMAINLFKCLLLLVVIVIMVFFLSFGHNVFLLFFIMIFLSMDFCYLMVIIVYELSLR